MLNKTVSEELVIANNYKIGLDRISIFVKSTVEVDAFRELDLHSFEYKLSNSGQGTISSIFFLQDLTLELIWIENQELAIKCPAKNNNFDLVSCVHWQRNKAIPIGFILCYLSNQKSQSKRRCYRKYKQEIETRQASSKISFSLKNLKNLNEPLCYIVPKSLTVENLLDSSSIIKRRLLAYHSRTNELTNIQITLNTSESLSKAISVISVLDPINIKRGKFPKLELKFGCGETKQFVIKTCSSTPVLIYY